MHEDCLGVPLRVGLSAASPRSDQMKFIDNPTGSLWAFRFYPSRGVYLLIKSLNAFRALAL